jgi:hypothetical protein
MSKLDTRYDAKPFFGRIYVTGIIKEKPVEYTLAIYHERQGKIKTVQDKFSTIENAIGHATLYGFLPHHWK